MPKDHRIVIGGEMSFDMGGARLIGKR
jgi:hypothetical protein